MILPNEKVEYAADRISRAIALLTDDPKHKNLAQAIKNLLTEFAGEILRQADESDPKKPTN